MPTVHADLAIARRLLSGDEQAFEAMFADYLPKLYRFALARLDGNPDDAIDVVQQTFCNAFEHLDSYRGEASLYGWMCRICANRITDLARQRQREQPAALLDDATAIADILAALAAPLSERPDQQLARNDLIGLIQATLDGLPGRYGDVLEWKYVDDLSVKEIALRLTIAPKAAESLLTRARAAFRQAITAIAGAADLLPDTRTGRGAE
ncbi:MAG: RNA polymerase sigma factor [Gammaproteobacteria bacterium]|nr:RNA polymerase sigma factor [Gammaproteobacteria bacterium]